MGLTDDDDRTALRPTGPVLTAGAGVLDRYRPAVLAVTAILAVVTVLPGARTGSGGDLTAQPPSPLVGTALLDDDPAAQTGETVLEPVSEPAPLALGVADVPVALPVPAAPAGDVGPAQAPDDPMPEQPGDQAGAPGNGAPEGPQSTRPLELRSTAWASRTAGTPLAASGVPEMSLPVGSRVNVLDKASFVRLSGDAPTLVLGEVAEGRRGDAAAARLQACRITDESWKDEQAQSFESAPSWDPQACVPGERADDGRWSFDLSQFPTRTDDRGFALVPGADAPADFQVSLQPT